MKTVSDSGTCIQEFKRCASTAGAGHASVVVLCRTQSNGFVCAVLQESCRVAFKTQTFWLSKLSEPLEIPAGVPEVISEDQVRGLNDQNCLEEPGFHETKRLMPSPSSHVFTLCCWSSSGPLLAQVTNWSLELPVSVLHMGRIHVALQLCQSLTCVMNSLPRNIPSDWSPVSH